MRGGERTVTVVGEDKNTEKCEKDKGVRKNTRVRGKRQGEGGKDKGSESTEKGEKDKGMGKNTRER